MNPVSLLPHLVCMHVCLKHGCITPRILDLALNKNLNPAQNAKKEITLQIMHAKGYELAQGTSERYGEKPTHAFTGNRNCNPR